MLLLPNYRQLLKFWSYVREVKYCQQCGEELGEDGVCDYCGYAEIVEDEEV